MDKTRIRTGRGQPNITCQNLGCYHAANQGLNCRPGLEMGDTGSDFEARLHSLLKNLILGGATFSTLR